MCDDIISGPIASKDTINLFIQSFPVVQKDIDFLLLIRIDVCLGTIFSINYQV